MIGKRDKFSGGFEKDSVEVKVTSGGRMFQRRHPATGNARSPTVDSRVCRITSCEDDDDRRRRWMNRRRSGCSRKDTVAPGIGWGSTANLKSMLVKVDLG